MHFLCPIWTMEGVKNVAKVSFDANKEHKLQEGGVKISADFKVDPKNELYASLPGEGTAKEFPFAEISIKHLNLQDGTNKAPLVKVADYKENLQFQVDEHIAINGIKLAGQEVDELTIGLYANLDLANAENNGTKLHLFANVKSNPDYMDPNIWSQDANPIDVTYVDGKLTILSNNASLIQALGVGVYPYDMLLAKPIGDLVSKVLPAEEKEKFENAYWTVKPGQKDGEGKDIAAKWNVDFKGIVLDHVTVSDILGLILPKQQAPATSSAEEKGNIYNTIVYAFTLLQKTTSGKLALASNDLAGTVANFAKYATGANWTIQGMADTIKQLAIDNGLKQALGVLSFNGEPAGDAIEMLLTDVKLNANFDFTDGIKWEIDIIRHEEERDEEGKLTTPGTHIKWTSSIKFGSAVEIESSDAYDQAKAAYETNLAAAQKAVTDAQSALDAANQDLSTKEQAYKATQSYQEYFTANEAYKTANAAYKAEQEKVKLMEGFADIEALIKTYDAASKAYENADKNETKLKDKTDADTAVSEKIATLTNKDAWQTEWTEYKAIIDKNYETTRARSKASTAYTKTDEYKAYNAAFTAQYYANKDLETAQTNLTAAQNAMNNWYYYDFALAK